MNTRIINELKEFYLINRERVHIILVEQKMRDVCDAYYMDDLNVQEISKMLDITIYEVKGRLLSAGSIMIRYKLEILEKSV